jgi:hypothetical protein
LEQYRLHSAFFNGQGMFKSSKRKMQQRQDVDGKFAPHQLDSFGHMKGFDPLADTKLHPIYQQYMIWRMAGQGNVSAQDIIIPNANLIEAISFKKLQQYITPQSATDLRDSSMADTDYLDLGDSHIREKLAFNNRAGSKVKEFIKLSQQNATQFMEALSVVDKARE